MSPFATTLRTRRRAAPRHDQRGLTMVELMVALLIGLFLIGGLLTLVGAMKRTSTIQGGLSLLHDSERLAMSLTTDVIQSAGYYPTPLNPGSLTAASAMPAVTVDGSVGTFAAGQIVNGSDGVNGSGESDIVSVRYLTAGGDNVINCTGGTSATAATWINTFMLDSLGNFECLQTTNGTAAAQPVVLVSGVKNLSILYGVQSNIAAGTHSVDSYLTASQVTAGSYWGSVLSVKITLSLTNPLAGQPGQLLTTIPFTRVIALMSQVGITT